MQTEITVLEDAGSEVETLGVDVKTTESKTSVALSDGSIVKGTNISVEKTDRYYLAEVQARVVSLKTELDALIVLEGKMIDELNKVAAKRGKPAIEKPKR